MSQHTTTRGIHTEMALWPPLAEEVGIDMSNVFISHRGSDIGLAERLAQELKTAGHDVWLDEWNLAIGDSIIHSIDAGLAAANYVIVCYSADGVMAPWMSREWMSALARQLNGVRVKVLPVRLSGGTPPAILADIKYADLVADWANGVRQLLRAMAS